jgi:DNA primase
MGVLDEIKSRIDIADLIGREVELRRAGRLYKGLCPFHPDRNPSFFVYPDQWTYHCFGCGAHGSGIDFVMNRRGLSFAEALAFLAREAGVELRPVRPAEPGETDRVMAANQLAAEFFQAMLRVHRPARVYLAGRGLDLPTVQAFGLGYAPADGTALLDRLAGAGFDADLLVAAGLAVRREGGAVVDRFRDRVMFPIRDARGRVVGFGGRVLGDGEPKYLNTPDTPVFKKGEVLYGLDLARSGIREAGVAVIVEGYFDVITAHQFGFKNVVGTLGTAITPAQARLLRDYCETVILCLDADPAGQTATRRALDLLWRDLADRAVPVFEGGRRVRVSVRGAPGLTVRVAILPAGKDPDEAIRQDRELFRRALAEARPVLDFLIEMLPQRFDLRFAEGKSAAARDIAPLLRAVPDPVVRGHYVQTAARALGVAEADLRLLIAGEESRPGPGHPARTAGTDLDPDSRKEEELLALLLRHPELKAFADDLKPDHFGRERTRLLFIAWREAEDGSWVDALPPDLAEYCRELADRLLPGDESERAAESFRDRVRLLEAARLRRAQELRDLAIAEAEAAGDLEGAMRLLEAGSELARERQRILGLKPAG